MIALALSGCGRGESAKVPIAPTGIDPAPASVDAAAPAAPTFAVVDGDWTTESVHAAVALPIGVTASDRGVSTVVATLGGDVTLARRGPAIGAPWELDPIADGSAFGSVVGGRLALRAGQPVALLVDVDVGALTYNLVYLEHGRREVIASGCDMADVIAADLIASEPAPIVTYACGGGQLIVRRDGARWTTLARLDQLVSGALDASGALVVLSKRLDADGRYWRLRDGALTQATMPEVSSVKHVAACGGRVHAFVERPGEGPDGDALATWTGADWQFEAIPADDRGVTTIGFDEACHPFVAIHDQVWSRGRGGWVASRPLPRDGSVRAVAAHRGVLYALATFIRDGQHATLASVPLRAD